MNSDPTDNELLAPLFGPSSWVWITTDSGATVRARVSGLVRGWVWVNHTGMWLKADEYTLATPAEILKAKLLGE